VGKYELPDNGFNAHSSLKKSDLTISKNERGLLPLDQLSLQKKAKVYNNSHAQVSPNSYNQDMDIYQKSVLRNSNKLAKQTGARIIDHSKWNS